MGFLSLWALGKLRAFDGSGHAWRLIVGLLPLFTAVWIGITRLQACLHLQLDYSASLLTCVLMPLQASAECTCMELCCPVRA